MPLMTAAKRRTPLSKASLPDIDAFVEAAVDACIAIDSRLHDRSDERLFEQYDIGAGGDRSMGFDLEAEKIAAAYLSPFGTVCSEESGKMGKGPCRIILDPLDGSDNFRSGLPFYGTSVALVEGERTLAGLVCDLGAKCCFLRTPQKHVRFPLYARTLHAPVVTNPHAEVGLFEKARLAPDAAIRLSEMGMKFRVPGAVALSFAYAHYVNYVLFLGTMRPYDMQAALYLCSDLHCHVDETIAIAAKTRDVFETLLEIFELPKDTP